MNSRCILCISDLVTAHTRTHLQAAASCNDRWVWLNQQQQAWPCHAVQQAPGMCDLQTPSSIRVAPAARWVAGRSSELFWFDLHLLGSHRIAWGAVCRPCRRPGCCCLSVSFNLHLPPPLALLCCFVHPSPAGQAIVPFTHLSLTDHLSCSAIQLAATLHAQLHRAGENGIGNLLHW